VKASFQTILIIISIVAFIAAILVFAGVIKVGSSNSGEVTGGSVVVWGTYPQDSIQAYFDQLTISRPDLSLQYVERNPTTLANDITRALSDGVAPDIVMSDSESLFSFADRLYQIPYTTYPERLYRDSFVDGASIFLSKEGVLAVPLTVDPLVVYYNKDLLAGQSYVVPPSTWTGLSQSISRFLKKDARGVITQTPIGLGETDNVQHFKDILSALFLQTGNPIVSSDAGRYQQRIAFGQSDEEESPTAKALGFYTSFVNQANSSYTWSRTLPSTLDTFLSGKSAFYIGRASELFTIQSRNPNLNFDVTTLFQRDGAVRPVTYGVFGGISILKSTPQFPLAYSTLSLLSSDDFMNYLTTSLSLPSAKRSLLLTQQQNPYVQVFFKAALSTFTWPDPRPLLTQEVFRDMVRAVHSGRSTPVQAIYQGATDLQSAITQ
jgi:ABC-type glycerol-3-phosphate transport system substrate-binding protein